MSTFPVPFVVVPSSRIGRSPTSSEVSIESRCSIRMSSQSQPSLPAGDSESNNDSAVNANSSPYTHSSIIPINSVWDFEKVTKLFDDDNCLSRRWHCGWCDSTFKTWNATKALAHVTKASGNNDIKACSGSIPKTTLEMFRSFRFQKIGAISVKRQREDAYAEKVADNQKSMSVMFESSRVRSSSTAKANNTIDITGEGGKGVEATNATRLTTAIADFIYSKGLPFSITEGEHFRQILKLSKLVSSTYSPPNRKSLANELLDISYDLQKKKYLTSLAIDAEVYGLSLFGDGATVHGMPLMNVLASGVGEPSAVLAIVDCKF